MTFYTASQKFIGKLATIQFGGLTVTVKILDVKTAFGHERFLITPIAGSGQIWVSTGRVLVEND